MDPAAVRQTCSRLDRQTDRQTLDRQTDKAAAGTSSATSRQDVAATTNVVLDEKTQSCSLPLHGQSAMMLKLKKKKKEKGEEEH